MGQVQQQEARGGRGQEGGDVRGGEVIDALQVHGVVGELEVVEEVEGGVREVGVHEEGFGAEARVAVAAGFGGAEGVFEDGLVPRVYYAKVVGHVCGGGG